MNSPKVWFPEAKSGTALSKELTMTMCIGFVCGNGLVVAADSQHTFPDGHTFHEAKVHSFKWKNGRAIWGYAASNSDTSKIVWEMMERRLLLEKSFNRTEIKTVLTEVLGEVVRSEEQFLMLVGSWTEGEHPVLLRSNGSDVVYGERCEVVGFGDTSLSRFWRDLFLKAIPNPSVWQASIAAIYFIMQAKKYNGQFVGGDTDGFVMAGSPATLIRVLTRQFTEAWEHRLEMMERGIVRF